MSGATQELSPLGRVANPVHWSLSCLDADCEIGSLVADALTAWSTGAGRSDFLVGMVPSRLIGGGLVGGSVSWEALSRALPAESLIELRITAHELARLLESSMQESWRSCQPRSTSGWQVSGLEFERRCGSASSAEGMLRLRSRVTGAVVVVAADTPVGVVTVASALELFPSQLATPVPLPESAPRVVADYIRSHSPLNLSTTPARLRTSGCGRSACDTPMLKSVTSALAATLPGLQGDTRTMRDRMTAPMPTPLHASIASGIVTASRSPAPCSARG